MIAALRRWVSGYWHRPEPILPHFGCTAQELTEHFEVLVRRHNVDRAALRMSFDPATPMTDLEARIVAAHIWGATP